MRGAVFVWCIVTLLGGCHLFDEYDDLSTVAVYFNETNVAIYEGGLGSLSVRVDPADSLEYNNIEYHISNDKIASIYQADNRGVVFSGQSPGSTVITAKLQNAEAKAVISVYAYTD